jgi:hypothetical protein
MYTRRELREGFHFCFLERLLKVADANLVSSKRRRESAVFLPKPGGDFRSPRRRDGSPGFLPATYR